jgi:hypothetical protein
MGPYRTDVVVELSCPRCHGRIPALDVVHCPKACGVWVSAFAATEILSDEERRVDLLTRWWRIREPCPLCHVQMTLRGLGDARFQGCDGHGYWLDADVVPFTGLANGVDEARLDAKRRDEIRMQREQEEREEAERKRVQERLDAQAREAALAKTLEKYDNELSPTIPPLITRADRVVMHSGSVPKTLIEKMAERIESLEARTAELEARLARLELRSL